LDLIPGATPKSCHPYPVPGQNQAVFKEELDQLIKEELDQLVEVGVLSCTGASEWLAPTFIVPKKDGRVRWVSNFRELNKSHQTQSV
jgi:hypothetical protein